MPAGTCFAFVAALAPGDSTIVFSPFSSTVMMATPVVPRRRVDAGEIDAGRGELAEGDFADVVIADRADEVNLRAGSSRRERLVGALAAGDQRIVGAAHRLARMRRARHPADEVDIDRAEDGDHGEAVSAR